MRWTRGLTQLVVCLLFTAGCDTLDRPDPPDVHHPTDPPVPCKTRGGGPASSPTITPTMAAVVAGPLPTPAQFAGPSLEALAPPPALSGGTLLATRDGKLLVAADPDRDLLYVVSVAERSLKRVLALAAGEQPGRLVEDSAGRVHVVLRGAGAIASFRPADMGEMMRARRSVCDLPRGIAYDAAHDQLHVACAEGKLVSLPADPSGEAQRTVDIGRDLRDVVVHDGRLFVTRFRAAELLEISDDGEIATRTQPPVAKRTVDMKVDSSGDTSLPFDTTADTCSVTQPGVLAGNPAVLRQTLTASPTVAWRAVETPSGVLMLHQQADDNEINITPGGYGANFSGCGRSIVRGAISMLGDGAAKSGTLGRANLAIDIAVASDGTIALAAPGAWANGGEQVLLFSQSQMSSLSSDPGIQDQCVDGASNGITQVQDQVTAVAFPSSRLLAVQTREAASIVFVDPRSGSVLSRVDLGQTSVFDTGHNIFHFTTSAGLACASCHAEGGDDGHVWNFKGIGPRRTQALRGGILGSEPFHWNGDMPSFDVLVSEVFRGRMSGFEARKDQSDALAHWIDKIPSFKVKAEDSAAAARGKSLFESDDLGCAGCHSGKLLTNNETFDVGTGVDVQVPSLHNVSFRLPLMHDGCAKTLLDRFDSCGGGDKHGHTSDLTDGQLSDVIAYLETL